MLAGYDTFCWTEVKLSEVQEPALLHSSSKVWQQSIFGGEPVQVQMQRCRLSQAGVSLLQPSLLQKQSLMSVSASDSYYDTLGVESEASQSAIKRAFLKVDSKS